MKKIALALFVICLFFVSSNTNIVFAESNSVMVIQNETNLYASTELSGVILSKVPHKAILDVQETVENIYTFYKVEYLGQIGFVYANHCLNTQYLSPTEVLDYNGKVIAETTKVYGYASENYIEVTNLILKKDDEIRILNGYDTSKEYTLISFKSGDSTLTYYVKTADISANGISRNIIIAVSLILTSASIILILFGVSFKKFRKKTENE